jgi:fructose-bisphosphate aldolase class I
MSQSLAQIAKQLVAPGKGILAADESVASVDKRFGPYGIPNNEENRRQFRLLYLAAPGIEHHLSGVILHEETVLQKTDHAQTFPGLLQGIGVLPGVKVDLGLEGLPNFPGETVTKGLDMLKERLRDFANLDLKFTKWRAAIPIDEAQNLPTSQALLANVHALARYALDCQEAGLVPIVEPEVLLDGGHSLVHSEAVLGRVLQLLFEHVHYYRVDLSALILKTSMAIAGSEHQTPSTPDEVAEATLSVLNTHVPKDTAGIVFLSGGQTPEQAVANLAALTARGKQPWPLTFSYARALQEPALAVWQGQVDKFQAGQATFLQTLEKNTAVLIR